MGFNAELDQVVIDIRNWAVKRMFEEEDYFAELMSGEQTNTVGWFERHFPVHHASKDLELPRYLKGDSAMGVDINREYVAREGTEVWQYKFDQLDWVRELFEGYGHADLGGATKLRDAIRKVPGELLGELSWFDGEVKNYVRKPASPSKGMLADILLEDGIAEIGHWEGCTASAFQDMFGTRGQYWKEVVQGDYYLSQMLVGGVEAQMAIVVAGRRDVYEIAKNTVETLKRNKKGEKIDGSVAMSIVGAVVTTLLAIGGGGGPIGALIAAGFALSTLERAEAEAAQEKKDQILGGGSAATILDSMVKALNVLNLTIAAEEEAAAKALAENYNGMLGEGKRRRFEIGFGSGELKPGSIDSMGTRTVEGQLDDLRRAAKTAFPAAGERMLTANARLGDTAEFEAGGFDSDITGSASAIQQPWAAMCDLLQDFTAANGEKVMEVGEALLCFAKQATDADYSAAEELYEKADFETSGRRHKEVEP